MSFDKKCLFCAAPIEVRGDAVWCPECHAPQVLIGGELKLNNDDWPERDYQHKRHNLRHPITVAVRSLLHDYIHGKELPRPQLNRLIGCLLDHHCFLEGLHTPKLELRPKPQPPRPFPPRITRERLRRPR